eukprot:scaffold309328_cov26-Tisochrysis_lutea.AAC.1
MAAARREAKVGLLGGLVVGRHRFASDSRGEGDEGQSSPGPTIKKVEPPNQPEFFKATQCSGVR